jgi:hypothetical protein
MTKKWIAINIALLAIAGLLGRYVLSSIREFKEKNNVATVMPAPEGKEVKVQDRIPPLPEQTIIYPDDYYEVWDKMVFSESRSSNSENPKEQAPTPEVPPLAQKPILVGTVISESRPPIAFIVDPTSPPGGIPGMSGRPGMPGMPGMPPGVVVTDRNRGSSNRGSSARGGSTRGGAPTNSGAPTITRVSPSPGTPNAAQNMIRQAQIKRIGDTYQGYTITSITAEYMVLESAGRRETIPLHEGSKQPTGEKTPIQAIRLVSIGPGGSATSSSPTGMPSGRQGSPVTAMMPTNNQPNTGRQGRSTMATTTNPMPSRGTFPQPPGGGGTGTDGNLIRTPFGDIIRPTN